MSTVERVPDLVSIRRALFSTYDKERLEELVSVLREVAPSCAYYATGGTYGALRGLLPDTAELVPLEQYTGQPEMEGGLVKSLDYRIYLGLLSETYNDAHHADLSRTGAVPFDLVVCNLYPFEEVVAGGADLETARANIDIGGPTLIRAAAKNYHRVAVLSGPHQYEEMTQELRRNGGRLPLSQRYRLAREAFSYVAAYDVAIAKHLEQQNDPSFHALYDVVKEEDKPHE